MSKRALLYVHIPFCIKRCRFCTACVVTGGSSAKRAYLEALEREITSALPTLAEYTFPAIYFGGGSPSVMRPDDLAALIRRLKGSVSLEQGAELTIEVMPQTVGTPSLSGIKAGGFRRISLSMQSAVAEELATLGCGFTTQDVQNAVLFCDRFGLNNLNLDIMYGIPGQTERSMERTLRTVQGYDPAHVSLYPFPGCPEIEGSAPAPSDAGVSSPDRLREQAEAFLAEVGFRQYAPHHFGKNGRESKYSRLRYEGMDYFGLGLGARSLVDGIAWNNTTDLDFYLEHSAEFESITCNVMLLGKEELVTCR